MNKKNPKYGNKRPKASIFTNFRPLILLVIAALGLLYSVRRFGSKSVTSSDVDAKSLDLADFLKDGSFNPQIEALNSDSEEVEDEEENTKDEYVDSQKDITEEEINPIKENDLEVEFKDEEGDSDNDDEDMENENEEDPEVDSGTADTFYPIPARISPLNPDYLVNYRTVKCTYFCQLILQLGYKLSSLMSASPLRNPPELLLINYKRYPNYSHLKRTIINQIGRGSSCIGGGKGRQLLCREVLAEDFGCDFADLNIQPPQFNIQTSVGCKNFYKFAESMPKDTIWIAKPGGSYHGKGITIHDSLGSLQKMFGTCDKGLPDGVIVQEYIKKPALMGNHKFDLRTYLLVASTDPFIVFYHDGFIRKASGVYSTDSEALKDPLKQVTNDVNQDANDHFFSFAQLQEVLTKEHGFPKDYMQKTFVPHAMRVTNYLFHSSYNKSAAYSKLNFVPAPGRFQLFALDWMIDSNGKMHLLEANGNPLVAHYENINLTPDLWTSMIQLVKMLHVQPEKLEQFGPLSVENSFKFKGWKLVYNQVEVEKKQMIFNPCKLNTYPQSKHPLYSYQNYGKIL